MRMHLLDKRYSAALQETLYCLLMCLPQTEAFRTLHRRLQCVPDSVVLQQAKYVVIGSYALYESLSTDLLTILSRKGIL
ncbi:unnamed protein product [Protopolystoma xenopodis]|uniref:Vacuolar protein 14 C-terminal Fig4-binding domain-containing protein n=1 Tax=Protopolystoma xenopodis TaxID=117903 RepID=A0A3S4ZY93_9PLAT|nr:unnamed protein product [Protopolystoma xenopodis]